MIDPILLSLVKALYDNQLTITANFNSFFFVVCLIVAKTLVIFQHTKVDQKIFTRINTVEIILC